MKLYITMLKKKPTAVSCAHVIVRGVEEEWDLACTGISSTNIQELRV